MLLQWNQQDPPDAFEKRRNQRIYERWQRNRNPFVDHPEWATGDLGLTSPHRRVAAGPPSGDRPTGGRSVGPRPWDPPHAGVPPSPYGTPQPGPPTR